MRRPTPYRAGRISALGMVVVMAVLVGGCTLASPFASQAGGTPRSSSGSASGRRPRGCPTAAPAALPAGQTRTVTIGTSKGSFAITVTANLAPLAAGNFVALATCGYYTGVVFHRLVPGFVVQGGDGQFGRAPNVDPSRVGTGGPGYTIQDETVTTTYRRGTVAMARTSQPNSQGSQFFIVLDDAAAASLAAANTYAIIGTVTSGMSVVDAIAAMPNSGSPANEALSPVSMDTVTVSSP